MARAIPVLAKRDLPDPEGEVLGLDGIAAAVALWYADVRAKDANWRELEGGHKLSEVSGAGTEAVADRHADGVGHHPLRRSGLHGPPNWRMDLSASPRGGRCWLERKEG